MSRGKLENLVHDSRLDIGTRFREFRRALNKTQKELAEEMNEHQAWISEIEHGRAGASEATLSGLHLGYGLNVNWLLTGKGDMYARADALHAIPTVHEYPPGYGTKRLEDRGVHGTVVLAISGDAGMLDIPKGADLLVDLGKGGEDGEVVAVADPEHERIVARRIEERPEGRSLVADRHAGIQPIGLGAAVVGTIVEFRGRPKKK